MPDGPRRAPPSSSDEVLRLKEQLRQAQKMEAVGRLAEGVAHDFNNLLTAINGYSELALLQLPEDHPLHAGLTEIRKAGARAAELTRRLLTLSRRQAVSPRKLDLNRIVADMEKLLRRVIGEDIALATRLDPQLRPIYADQGQIEQILLNLAINARDAMPEGGRLTFETANGPAGAGGSPLIPSRPVQLAVHDTGEGMHEEIRARAFEPFFTTRELGHNTGLGLAVVYSIVQQCGGHVEIESEAGSGCVLRVYLPPAAVPEAADATAVADASPASLPRGGETVLLVEDEPAVRDLVRNILQLQGYRVLAAANARAALELCDGFDGRLDLLLTDVVMPETSGPSLAEGLQHRFPELKVLFMSGYTDSNTGVRLLNQKRAAFLPKPFSPEILAHKVRAVLDRPEDPSPEAPTRTGC